MDTTYPAPRRLALAGGARRGRCRSTAEGERMSDAIRWIRSYVLEEGSGVGTSASTRPRAPGDPRHAAAADLPVDEIVRVADTVVVRPDPALAPVAS